MYKIVKSVKCFNYVQILMDIVIYYVCIIDVNKLSIYLSIV